MTFSMSDVLTVVRQSSAVALVIVLSAGAVGCKDSGSVSEAPPVKLSSLTVTPPGGLQPTFSPDVLDYTAVVSTTDTTVVVRVTPENSSTTMTIDGRSASAGQGATVTLGEAPSTKNIAIRLTDQSGTQTTYVVSVTRPASSNTDLRSLSVSPGPLDRTFQAGTTSYTVNADSATPSIRVTATLQDTSSTLKVDGQDTTSGQPRTINLGAPGSSRDISFLVTAQNGTQKIYTVTVIKAALGGNNNLQSLTVSPGSLDPTFSTNTTRYALSAGSGTDDVRVAAALQDTTGTLEINQQGTPSGQTRTINLGAPGSTTEIEILAIAPNGSSKRYIIAVTRAALSADNNLEALSVSPGTLTPGFSSGTTQYAVEVATGVTSVAVTATKSDPNAVITGDITNSGQANIPLDGPGTTKTISMTVTAPNGDTKIYAIAVERLAPSTDSNLSALTTSAGTLLPTFSPSQLTYGTSVSANDETVTVSAVKSDPNAVLSSAGSIIAATGVQTGGVTVSLGRNTTTAVSILVTAQDGISRKTYTINFFRPDR